MFAQLKDFFSSLDNKEQSNTIISTELACAVLFCEVMRADNHYTIEEQTKLTHLLQNQFSLSDTEVTDIIEQAIQLSENANDFFQFTSQLNQHLSLDERIHIVSLLWQIAYADGELASIEEHIIRRIADLLHLRHSEYIATKIQAQSIQQ
ncbi:TerB family tellurite resistance protein [Litorilituus lipolyticus]|uniref:TerB family tellurite resistance protein n=1 Tax=Litorilituus lipolyticus TaxID=2491017 RepID=A0A502KPJ6_9GAMM|nr:TerB family tellurite resistance protein [Litorilituus lipolyticus]TPH12209.1 TerB family tellurite resistance protein [Litorilituus lipolyticus]